MNMPEPLFFQHLIDPELCIRCNTCEESCPSQAISNDGRNYVVNPSSCNGCKACLPGCPTGAIDVWLPVPLSKAYPIADQFGWDSLPQATALADSGDAPEPAPSVAVGRGAPASAATPSENLYTRQHPASARVLRNDRVTPADSPSDIHHVVLDFGHQPFPYLEGQSIGILPPGLDARGKPQQMRLYSIASARHGEGGQGGTLALTVKRVTTDPQGQPHHGVCSHHVCDTPVGGTLQVVGPYGASFLLPEDPQSSLLMICTGTGIAPMRSMIERRRAVPHTGTQRLFYGGRSAAELPYLAELQGLGQGWLDLNVALSRAPGQPRHYVQDLLTARHADVAQWLQDDTLCIYLCGLKGMESGVLDAFAHACAQHGLDWSSVHTRLHDQHRLHIETY